MYSTIGFGTTVEQTASLIGFVKIGKNCYIGPGVCIGQRGFGYEQDEDGDWRQKKHEFGVIIGDNVEIGANTCIDRGSWRDTYIGDGTKIDNLVHVAHNVQVMRNCLIVAGAKLGGSVVVEDEAYIGLNSSVLQRLRVEKRGFVGAGAVVIQNVPVNMVVAGVPATVRREREESDL